MNIAKTFFTVLFPAEIIQKKTTTTWNSCQTTSVYFYLLYSTVLIYTHDIYLQIL